MKENVHPSSDSVDYMAKVVGLPQFGQDGSEALKITVRHKTSQRGIYGIYMYVTCKAKRILSDFSCLSLK